VVLTYRWHIRARGSRLVFGQGPGTADRTRKQDRLTCLASGDDRRYNSSFEYPTRQRRLQSIDVRIFGETEFLNSGGKVRQSQQRYASELVVGRKGSEGSSLIDGNCFRRQESQCGSGKHDLWVKACVIQTFVGLRGM
jgi:hypothetical protein